MNQVKVKELEKLEWDPLLISSKEVLKMLSEDFITRQLGCKELLQYSEALKSVKSATMPSVDRYKLNLINRAHEAISDGIFSMQDIENLKYYYSLPEMTIFGTPRKLTSETEMAWAIIYPLIERIERWLKILELSDARIINEQQVQEAREAVVSSQPFGEKLQQSVVFLDRIKYAKRKGILKEADYNKAIKLIPLMRQEILGEKDETQNLNSEEVLKGIEEGDKLAFEQQVASEENIVNGFEEQSNPINEWKRLVYILIDAWQATLNAELREEFKSIELSNDLEVLRNVHRFLVHLNKEYIKDDRSDSAKREFYLEKIQAFVRENFKKTVAG